MNHVNQTSVAAGPNGDALERRLQAKLTEAYGDLWDSIVDPREPFWDDGSEWLPLGSAGGAGLSRGPFSSELELTQIRDQCRALAVNNEFAINGHENRISYLVGSGHTYRAAIKKGTDAPAD